MGKTAGGSVAVSLGLQGLEMGRLQVFAFSFLGNSEEKGRGVCV